jgi:protein TonB
MNLGGGDSLTNAIALGPAVEPAKPDSHHHNREPVYPREAAERGEQGTVLLLVHVGPDGGVLGVDVAASSGYRLLDHAARDAVQTWHFLPAVRDGTPVAAELPLRIVFEIK